MNPFRDMPARPERGDWQESAVCGAVDNGGNLIHDISDWHPDGNKKERAEARARARRKCVTCPVAMSCFAEALANEEPTGVWGGVDLDEMRRRTREPLDPGYGRKWQTLARQSRRDVESGAAEAKRRADKRAYDAARHARRKATENTAPVDLVAALEAQRATLDAIVEGRLA